MNIDALLKPISEESPCGEELEYDIEFMELENSLIGKVEQQFGDITIPAEPPNWLQVEKQAIELLTRTKDLRVIIPLTQSWLEMRGLCGYADGLNLLKQTLERYWDEVWPKLEFEGEYDPLFRLNILSVIEDNSPLTLQAQHCVLLKNKNTSEELSLQEIYSLLNGSITQISGYTGGRPRLLEQLKQYTNSPEMMAIMNIHDHLISILNIISQKMSENSIPEISRFLKNLEQVIECCPSSQSEINIDEQSIDPNSVKPISGLEQKDLPSSVYPKNETPINWYNIEARSRDDARMLLEKAKNYFLVHEPSHPAPIMIDRIQRLIDRGFIDIVYDLAPDGLNQLEVIFGRSDNSNHPNEQDDSNDSNDSNFY